MTDLKKLKNDPEQHFNIALLKGDEAEARALLALPEMADFRKDPEAVQSSAALAIIMDMPGMILPLLKDGVDINVATPAGNTLLHVAATSDRAEAAKILLENGANPALQNNSGLAPWELAEEPALITLLYEAKDAAEKKKEYQKQQQQAHQKNIADLNRLFRPRRPSP